MTTLAIIVFSALLPSVTADEVNRYLEEIRPEKYGPSHKIAEAAFDVNADQIDDLLVLYKYEIGPTGHQAHVQYLVVFISSPSGYIPTISIQAGYLHGEEWDRFEINGDEIWLVGRKWLAGDACNPPAAIARTRVVVSDGQTLFVEGYWQKVE